MKQLTIKSLTCAALAVGILSGCADMSETQRGTAQGAGIGAVAGALLGAATDGSRGAAKGAVLGGALGAGGGYIWSKKMQEQKAAMEKATAGTGVAVSQTADNRLKLDIPSDVSFDVGRSAIKPNFAPVLNHFATSLNQNTVTTVTIIGHTDSTGSDAINNPLSVDRANAARDYLVSRGVARTRIVTDGRGSREPVADNSTQQGRDKNRRVEIYVAEQVAAR
jgi:outer membrane protein OmpA-like peptidoglycan-associated protein